MANLSNRDKRIRRKVRHSYIISTVSISLVLFLLGIVSYVTFSAIKTVLDPALNVVVSVEMSSNLWENEKADIRAQLESRDEVESIVYLSGEEKLNSNAIPFEVDLEIFDGENPLPDSFEVTFKKEYADAQHINRFAAEVANIENVEYIDKPDLTAFEESKKNVSAITLALGIFVLVLLFISLLLLNNTLRLAIYSKRYLINTMKLVGATKWYIMRPLLWSALKQGLVSGIIAAALMCGTIYGIAYILPEGIEVIGTTSIAILIGIMLFIGIVITVGFSAMAINKFVNMKSNKIHLY